MKRILSAVLIPALLLTGCNSAVTATVGLDAAIIALTTDCAIQTCSAQVVALEAQGEVVAAADTAILQSGEPTATEVSQVIAETQGYIQQIEAAAGASAQVQTDVTAILVAAQATLTIVQALQNPQPTSFSANSRSASAPSSSVVYVHSVRLSAKDKARLTAKLAELRAKIAGANK